MAIEKEVETRAVRFYFVRQIENAIAWVKSCEADYDYNADRCFNLSPEDPNYLSVDNWFEAQRELCDSLSWREEQLKELLVRTKKECEADYDILDDLRETLKSNKFQAWYQETINSKEYKDYLADMKSIEDTSLE